MIVIPPIHEQTFSVDDFNEPKQFKNARAVMALLTRMLLLDPGTIQTHPECGVGLVSRYRYATEGEEYNLKSDIIKNITNFLPQFQGAQVQVQMVNHSFRINIVIENYVFGFLYDIDGQNLSGKYKKIQDL